MVRSAGIEGAQVCKDFPSLPLKKWKVSRQVIVIVQVDLSGTSLHSVALPDQLFEGPAIRADPY